MRVRVEFVGLLREAAGCDQMFAYVEEGSSLLDLLKALSKSYGARFRERVFATGKTDEISEDLSILINGKVVPITKASSTRLNENDTVVLMPEVII